MAYIDIKLKIIYHQAAITCLEQNRHNTAIRPPPRRTVASIHLASLAVHQILDWPPRTRSPHKIEPPSNVPSHRITPGRATTVEEAARRVAPTG